MVTNLIPSDGEAANRYSAALYQLCGGLTTFTGISNGYARGNRAWWFSRTPHRGPPCLSISRQSVIRNVVSAPIGARTL